jgi:hypothetical protein
MYFFGRWFLNMPGGLDDVVIDADQNHVLFVLSGDTATS